MNGSNHHQSPGDYGRGSPHGYGRGSPHGYGGGGGGAGVRQVAGYSPSQPTRRSVAAQALKGCTFKEGLDKYQVWRELCVDIESSEDQPLEAVQKLLHWLRSDVVSRVLMLIRKFNQYNGDASGHCAYSIGKHSFQQVDEGANARINSEMEMKYRRAEAKRKKKAEAARAAGGGAFGGFGGAFGGGAFGAPAWPAPANPFGAPAPDLLGVAGGEGGGIFGGLGAGVGNQRKTSRSKPKESSAWVDDYYKLRTILKKWGNERQQQYLIYRLEEIGSMRCVCARC
jgi:hypothetical protein